MTSTFNNSPARPIQYLSTSEAYSLWSSIYDSDGNFLQALDSHCLKTLLPKFLSQLPSSAPPIYVDLGCGTGRSTSELIRYLPSSLKPGTTVYGLDGSPAMLDIARPKLDKEIAKVSSITLSLSVFDILDPPTATEIPLASAMISTLVLEHIPIQRFFATASERLAPGGIFLVTNMHAEMGRVSQAGFVEPETGQKVRPESFAHEIDDVVKQAGRHGMEVIEGLTDEKGVEEEMVDLLGERSMKWVGGPKVWFSIGFRKTTDELVREL